MATATTFWRLAGMTYLEYSSTCTSTVRSALKEPARSKALARDVTSYTRYIFSGGKAGTKQSVEGLDAVADPK